MSQTWLNWRVWLPTRVWAILSALAQMSRAKGDASTWQMLLRVWVRFKLTKPLWWGCNHLSQQWKPNSLRARSPFKGYREKSCASGTRKETREQGVLWGKSSFRALRFLRPSLARSLATRNGEVASSPKYFLGIPGENSSYFHTKQRPLWLHVSFFHTFHPTLNN